MKRITLEELQKQRKTEDYQELCQWIFSEIEKGTLKPVKASGLNGKKPALYLAYWLTETEKDYGDLKEELKYFINPLISNDYYLNNLEKYNQEREWVLLLHEFLTTHRACLEEAESINERSFEIWWREKFLKRGGGIQLLKHCGISPEQLNLYETTEPMAYYCHSRQIPQKILILENKDTFYSMRKHLLEKDDRILGVKVGTLIYGAGKGIWKSFQDFKICAEPYMTKAENQILYFGDLDYEGIGIYERLAKLFPAEILPFRPGYEAMIAKAVSRGGADYMKMLPVSSENQNQNISERFFEYFPEQVMRQMKEILKEGRYIPQEILNGQDFGEMSEKQDADERTQEYDTV